jgi:hypothetical protein
VAFILVRVRFLSELIFIFNNTEENHKSMKHTTHILKMAVALFLATYTIGCADLLDLKPPMDEVSENFYITEEDAFQSLTSAYNVLIWSAPSTAFGSPQNCAFEIVSEMLGDCCYAGGANANDIPSSVRLSQFAAYVTDPAPEALWRKYYSGIYRCNQFFEKIDDIVFKDNNLKERYKAEAHFLRAYYYFDLVRLFGNVPLILKVLTPAEFAQVQAEPAVIYEQIAKDLLAAINAKDENDVALLPANALQLAATDKGRVNLASAQSLLARVWLYYTGYYGKDQLPLVDQTKILAIIREAVASGHSLMPDAYSPGARITGSSKLFDVTMKNKEEGVFEIQYSALSKWGDWGNRMGCLGNQAVILWGIRDVGSPYAAGWSFAPVNKKLFEAFAPTDPRRWASIINANQSAVAGDDGEGLNYTKGYQNTGYFCRKFTPFVRHNASSGSRELNYPNNYMSIRFADVLLMSAELEFLHGSKTTAFDSYKKVRERALGIGNAGTNGGAANEAALTLQHIYNERYFELALEGHRYWDILRQGQTKAAQLLTNNEQGEFAVTYSTQRAGLFPIPQFDITQSKNSLKQNPGY